KAAGKLARGCRPLAIVASQRKEIDADSPGAGGHRTNDNGVAVLGQPRRRGLFGQISRFKRENAAADLLFNSYFHCLCLPLRCVPVRVATRAKRRNRSRTRQSS